MENLASLEPFLFRTFQDSWISEAYARDTETLTKALQKAHFSATNNNFSSDIHHPPLPTTPTASNIYCSDPETVAPPSRLRNVIPPASGKVSKRKTRASKRSQTTFITADPANFRQMVQQVTGIRFGNGQLQLVPVPVLKPEPQRPGTTRLHDAAGYLPTLDTSAFLLDHQQQQQPIFVGSGTGTGTGTVSYPQQVIGDGGPTTGLEFESFSSFPTLESWKAM